MTIAISTDDIYLCIDQLKLAEDYTVPTNVWKYAYDYEKDYVEEVHAKVHSLRVRLEVIVNDDYWSDTDRTMLLRETIRNYKQIREKSFLFLKWMQIRPDPDFISWPNCAIILEFKSSGIKGASAAHDKYENYFHGLIPPESTDIKSIRISASP